MKYLLNFFRFWLSPITDDWKGGVSLIRLTFIALMYGIYKLLEKNQPIDWSHLIIILFLLIYLCFKGDAAPLISQLLNSITSLKSSTISAITKKEEPTTVDSPDTQTKE